jgi:hypothetical protein
MERTVEKDDLGTTRPCSPFEEFFHLFSIIRSDKNLFPKACRTCGAVYNNYAQYLCLTRPKGHVFEDCSAIMNRPFTMVYRHCSCGNTLVLTLTAETFPELERFWSRLAQEASESCRPLVEVVAEFSAECDRHILDAENPCGNSPEAGDVS